MCGAPGLVWPTQKGEGMADGLLSFCKPNCLAPQCRGPPGADSVGAILTSKRLPILQGNQEFLTTGLQAGGSQVLPLLTVLHQPTLPEDGESAALPGSAPSHCSQ